MIEDKETTKYLDTLYFDKYLLYFDPNFDKFLAVESHTTVNFRNFSEPQRQLVRGNFGVFSVDNSVYVIHRQMAIFCPKIR